VPVLEVGIDIGGTKTHLRVYGSSGEHRDLTLPTAEWRVREWTRDAIALLALADRFVDGAPIRTMAVGAHGCDDAAECDAFQIALARNASFPIKVVNDAELLPAALGLEHQIGLVAGTGSIAVCRDPKGRMLVAGGWGWVIGDEGSASGLMREAGRAVKLHLDCGGTASEPLAQLLLQALGITTPARIGSAIVRVGSAAALGSHAHILFDAAEMGSSIARQVICNGAKELAELVVRLKHRGSQATTVVAGGGLIASQPILAAAFFDQIEARFGNGISVKLYVGPPVEGACRIASNLSS